MCIDSVESLGNQYFEVIIANDNGACDSASKETRNVAVKVCPQNMDGIGIT